MFDFNKLEELILGEKINPCPDRIPQPGDKIILLDGFYELMPDGKECAKLARLPYCTVESAMPIAVTNNKGEYEYKYHIYINETGYMVGFYNEQWKFLEDK